MLAERSFHLKTVTPCIVLNLYTHFGAAQYGMQLKYIRQARNATYPCFLHCRVISLQRRASCVWLLASACCFLNVEPSLTPCKKRSIRDDNRHWSLCTSPLSKLVETNSPKKIVQDYTTMICYLSTNLRMLHCCVFACLPACLPLLIKRGTPRSRAV